MRLFPLAALAALAPLPALAELDLSAELSTTSISAMLEQLRARPAPDADTHFAIAGLEFLGAVERTYQLRARHGLEAFFASPFTGYMDGPHPPAPEPLTAEVITQSLTDTLAAMERARAALDAIPSEADPALIVDFGAPWFDIDGDGARGDGEGMADLVGPALVGTWTWRERPQDAALPVIRFDAADRHWLRAYTQLISGTTEMILAYDPAPAIARVLASRAEITAAQPDPNRDLYGFGSFVDVVAMLDGTLRQRPDATRTRAARTHWLGMIADNRLFWAALATETDNDREWIPNDRQTSALGIEFPEGLDQTWGAVLDDAEALLTGTRAIPFWRAPIGLDLNAFLENPAPVDFVGWVQGWAALEYRSDAPPISDTNWRAFSRVVQGRTGLMMLTLN
ncbi:hypothetical protein [Pseudothioclava nitratireducens]|uniref:hypothetical protein n=1 Tax=Pseudothioclava nitratireducens TaxID=1928646 RepID=UPI0023DC56CF|nr:hypothetical protein [Defluviimonas nitratireducens]MDF1619177.1 hypothetical protein [Defluviimonas nitratireducens]